jgi:hypothetical protein
MVNGLTRPNYMGTEHCIRPNITMGTYLFRDVIKTCLDVLWRQCDITALLSSSMVGQFKLESGI